MAKYKEFLNAKCGNIRMVDIMDTKINENAGYKVYKGTKTAIKTFDKREAERKFDWLCSKSWRKCTEEEFNAQWKPRYMLELRSEKAYIVTKTSKVKAEYGELDFKTNEAIFDIKAKADDYIKKRKALKDRDDKGCTFDIEPWQVQ